MGANPETCHYLQLVLNHSMVHIGCGADVIRQRRRAQEQRKQNEANGIFYIPPDFKPAKNKKYPHYTPLRNARIFEDRQKLSFMRKKALYKQSSQPSVNDRPPTLASQQKKSGSLPYTEVLFSTKNSFSAPHSDHIKSPKRSDVLDEDTKVSDNLSTCQSIPKQKSWAIKSQRQKALADVHYEANINDNDDDPQLINDLHSFMELHPLKSLKASLEDLCILEYLVKL